jgi:uncharacterized membrane protein YgdD (TMEM256/DUF423 family)
LAAAWIAERSPSPAARLAGWAFVADTMLFSGSLCAMTFTGVRALGAITPLGGVALFTGWIALAVAAAKR